MIRRFIRNPLMGVILAVALNAASQPIRASSPDVSRLTIEIKQIESENSKLQQRVSELTQALSQADAASKTKLEQLETDLKNQINQTQSTLTQLREALRLADLREEHDVATMGGPGGDHAYRSKIPVGQIRKVRIRAGNVVNALNINDSGWVGGTQGAPESGFELAPGEFVSSIEVHWGKYVDMLIFTTSTGNVYKFGGTGGPNRKSFDLKGERAVGVYGMGGIFIDSIGIVTRKGDE
jgi:Jacalin-like lectin domain